MAGSRLLSEQLDASIREGPKALFNLCQQAREYLKADDVVAEVVIGENRYIELKIVNPESPHFTSVKARDQHLEDEITKICGKPLPNFVENLHSDVNPDLMPSHSDNIKVVQVPADDSGRILSRFRREGDRIPIPMLERIKASVDGVQAIRRKGRRPRVDTVDSDK